MCPSYLKHLAILAALLSCSCATTRTAPPPAGMGVMDVTPDASRRDRIDGIGIVSVNGQPVSGTEVKLNRGRTRVRVRFSWPQGGKQEVDLDFKVKAGTIYVAYYDVHPPVSRQTGVLESATGSMLDGAVADPYAGGFAVLLASFMTPATVAEKATRQSIENTQSANYVDVMVVAQRSPDGVVCNRRVYPDGRIEKR